MKNVHIEPHGFIKKRKKMEDDPDEIDYYEYISALKELVDTQKKARDFTALIPHKPAEESSELTLKGKEAIQPLIKVYEILVEKYKAWRNSLRAFGL